MIISKESGLQQVQELLLLYKELQLESVTESRISLKGRILINRDALGFKLYKGYYMKIIIPLESEELPYVIDLGGHIEDVYPHKYSDGKLCLETDTQIRVRFLNGFSLTEWMEEYVELYYFSYEYHRRYGRYPFGERSHGVMGLIETYSEFFKEKDLIKTVLLMKAIVANNYRGHALCPCGSGMKYRQCHGEYTKRFYFDDRLNDMVKFDYYLLMEAVGRYGE